MEVMKLMIAERCGSRGTTATVGGFGSVRIATMTGEPGLVRGVYGSRLAAKLGDVTLRKLRYWVATGLLEPSIYRAGKGGRDLFSYTDIVQLRVIARLRRQR